MDKKNTKMKKFNPLRGVLDGLRSTVSAPPKGDVIDIEETLRSDHFQISKVKLYDSTESPLRLYRSIQVVSVVCLHCFALF